MSMSEIAEPIEAVIISGPRRGEIIRLPEVEVPVVSDEEIRLLNKGVDLVETALDRLEAAMRDTIEAFQVLSETREEPAGQRERLAGLKASRDAGRRQFQAELARFETEVEWAKSRLARRPSGQEGPTVLPEERNDETCACSGGSAAKPPSIRGNQ
jgi:hypothetical protein